MSDPQAPARDDEPRDGQPDGALTRFEDGFDDDGLPSFCRRPRRRPRSHLLGAGAVVAAVELATTLPDRHWPWWTTAAVSLASLCALAGVLWASWHAPRHLAHHRWWTRHLELAAVLAVPPLVNAAAHTWSGRASALWGANAVVLVLLSVDDRTGLTVVARWSLHRTGSQLRHAAGQLVRTVPLLTAVLLATFVAAEPWQVAADMGVVNIAAAVVLLGGVGLGFAVRRSLDSLGTGLVGHHGVPLRRRERLNLGFNVAFTQGFTVAVAATLFSVLLTSFNALAVTSETVSTWAQREVPELWGAQLGGLHLSLTSAHLAVGALGAAFASLAFAVSLAGDDQYHDLARDEDLARLQDALARREEYLELVGRPA